MKVLWITNILFPDVCEVLNIPKPVIGGWMYSLARLISKQRGIKLYVASTYSGNVLREIEISGISYFLLPLKTSGNRYNPSLEKYWIFIKEAVQPDVIHIHGTEFTHGMSFLKSCGSDNVVLSIQGLLSVYADFYYAGMSLIDIVGNITFRDIVKRDTLFQQKRKFIKRSCIEKKYIESVKNVIGRTQWDYIHALNVNSELRYYHVGEILRDSFYKYKWSYNACERHSIFLSQAGYPIKGLHQVLKALSIVLKVYPNTKVYVSGGNICSSASVKDIVKRGGYGKYIQKILRKMNLSSCVIFTGSLSEQEMCDRYLKSNLFICPSSIENSPNSLAEAQILGVPCIASYVGGVPSMVKDSETGYLYRFEDYVFLANLIIKIFSSSDNDLTLLSENERQEALMRHSYDSILHSIVSVYKAIQS